MDLHYFLAAEGGLRCHAAIDLAWIKLPPRGYGGANDVLSFIKESWFDIGLAASAFGLGSYYLLHATSRFDSNAETRRAVAAFSKSIGRHAMLSEVGDSAVVERCLKALRRGDRVESGLRIFREILRKDFLLKRKSSRAVSQLLFRAGVVLVSLIVTKLAIEGGLLGNHEGSQDLLRLIGAVLILLVAPGLFCLTSTRGLQALQGNYFCDVLGVLLNEERPGVFASYEPLIQLRRDEWASGVSTLTLRTAMAQEHAEDEIERCDRELEIMIQATPMVEICLWMVSLVVTMV